jgi:hypothetical protein
VNVNYGIEGKGSVGASGAGRVQNVEIEPIPQAISTFYVLRPHNVERMPDPRTKSTFAATREPPPAPGLPSMPQLTFTTAGALSSK